MRSPCRPARRSGDGGTIVALPRLQADLFEVEGVPAKTSEKVTGRLRLALGLPAGLRYI
jgi:hypothetical protein